MVHAVGVTALQPARRPAQATPIDLVGPIPDTLDVGTGIEMPAARRNASTGRRLSTKGAEKRQEILDAAAALFALNGYRGTGITEVARRAGLSHVGLLHHFGTKEKLLLAVVADLDERQQESYAQLRGLRGRTALIRMSLVTGRTASPAPFNTLFLVLIAENLHRDDPLNEYFRARYARSREYFIDAIRTGQEDGEFRPGVDAESIATQAFGLLLGGAIQNLADPGSVDLPRCYAEFVERLLADLGTAGPG